MKRTGMHFLEPSSALKKIAAAKSNKPFMAALLDCDPRGHEQAVGQWTRLHEAAFPEPESSAGIVLGNTAGGAFPNFAAISTRRDGGPAERDAAASPRRYLRPVKSTPQDILNADDRRGSRTLAESLGELQPPVVNMEADRIQVLPNDAPARFEIEESPDADPDYGAWRSLHRLNWHAVGRHQASLSERPRRKAPMPISSRRSCMLRTPRAWTAKLPRRLALESQSPCFP